MLHVFSTNTKETTSRQLQDSLIDYCLTKGSWSYNRMAGKLYISILYNNMVQNKEELLEVINSIPYPDFPFKPLPENSESQIDFKAKQKEIRKGKYQQSKSFYKEDADKKKQRLEKERQARKERYKKMKENKSLRLAQ